MARIATVDLVAQVNTLSQEQVLAGKAHLLDFCRSVDSVPGVPYRHSLAKALRVLVDPVPATARHKRNPSLDALLKTKLERPYDAVVATISGAPGATVSSLVSLGAHPLILDSLELGVFRPKPGSPSLRRIRNTYTWWHLRRFTRDLLRHVEAVVVTSDAERSLFLDLLPAPEICFVIPNAIDLREYAGDFGAREDFSLLYPGSFRYSANYEAMLWFAEQVFHRIPEHDKLTVTVTGDTSGRDLTPMITACPQLQFAGYVEDIRPYFACASACIVPLLAGGSTRVKIIEAMAWGTPVVSTCLGAEGLEVTHDENILLANTPQEFAACVSRLLTDQRLWQGISDSGRRLVSERYSVETLRLRYQGVLEKAVNRVAGRTEAVAC